MKSTRLALSFFELSSMLGCCQWISTPSKITSSIIRATLLIIDWIAEVGENSFVDIVRERIRRNRPPFWELINFKCATISKKIRKKKDNDDACYHLLYSRTRNRPNLAIDWKSRQWSWHSYPPRISILDITFSLTFELEQYGVL